jgi:hypothetical protein
MGIGTTTPGAKLVVSEPAGGAEVRVDGLNGTVGLSLVADATQPWVGTRTNHALRLFTNSTEQMRVQADGRVGIGTTTPGARLEIRGSSEPLCLLNHTGAAGNPALWLQQEGVPKALVWWDQANNRFNLGTPTTNPIVSLQNTGNVGIGTPSPATKLDVAGTVQMLTGANPIRFTASWNGFPDAVTNQAEISNDTAAFRTLMIVGNRAAGLGRRVSVWDRLEVNGTLITTGNVGIGTDQPGFRLDVTGRIRLRQGGSASAGLWLFQSGTNTDRAFIGMASDNLVGFWGNGGVGWALQMDVNDGTVYVGANKSGTFARFNDDLWFYDPQNGTIWTRNGPNNNFGTMVGFFQAPSSREFKKEISIVQDADLEHLLAETLQTDLVHFRYKNDAISQRLHLGVIAEDAPDTIVGTDGQSLATSEYIAMLHGAIKALASKFVALCTANEHLQASDRLLETKLQDLERKLSGGQIR